MGHLIPAGTGLKQFTRHACDAARAVWSQNLRVKKHQKRSQLRGASSRERLADFLTCEIIIVVLVKLSFTIDAPRSL